MIQCEREAALLTAEYGRTTDEKERSKVKESLAKALEKEFDLHQKARSQEIEQIEARVKRLRNLMDKRNQARKTIVNARLDQLIRDSEGLGWTPNSTILETQGGVGVRSVGGVRSTLAVPVGRAVGGGGVTVPAPMGGTAGGSGGGGFIRLAAPTAPAANSASGYGPPRIPPPSGNQNR
jgi:hypothetical protein